MKCGLLFFTVVVFSKCYKVFIVFLQHSKVHKGQQIISITDKYTNLQEFLNSGYTSPGYHVYYNVLEFTKMEGSSFHNSKDST